jgi:hypothetical protein
MKKIGKKLSAILFVALCCVLLFPITAMAVELTKHFFFLHYLHLLQAQENTTIYRLYLYQITTQKGKRL